MRPTNQLFMFISESHLNQGNTLMKTLDRNPEDTGDDTFGTCQLSITGEAPISHYGASTFCDEDYKNALFGTSHSPWMTIYKQSDGWTFESATADMGLIRVTIDE